MLSAGFVSFVIIVDVSMVVAKTHLPVQLHDTTGDGTDQSMNDLTDFQSTCTGSRLTL